MSFAVSSPAMSIEELSWFVEDAIKRGLQGQPGVGRVDRYGGADREILDRARPDQARQLRDHGGTGQPAGERDQRQHGSGRAEIGDGEQAIRVLGDAAAADELAKTTIALPSGRFVNWAIWAR